MAKPAKQGLMVSVLSRMAATETLISDRHTDSMLLGLLQEAEKVEDPTVAWATVRGEMCERWGFSDRDDMDRKPFLYADGVAYIPIHGILLNRFSYCWGFVTGYDFIRRQLNAAEEDPDVQLVVYDTDSPGGEAVGCDEMAREMRAAKKPSLAMVNSLAASGGFWLASAADRVVCVPSGSVGSIGVYIMHMNMQKMLADWGLEVDYIQAGEFKTAGNPYREMTRKERQYLQAMVDERYDEFCGAVAEFRGIEESVARDTEARVMRPKEAIALGLIDAAASPAEAVSDFLAELGGEAGDPNSELEDEVMADNPEMTSEQRAEARAAERTRIKGITTHAEAKGRESLAEHLAHNTDMSVEEAAGILAASPKAEDEKPAEGNDTTSGGNDTTSGGNGNDTTTGAEGDDTTSGGNGDDARGKSQFEQAMDSGDHPNLSGGKGGEQGKGSRVDQILAAQELVTGRKTPKA